MSNIPSKCFKDICEITSSKRIFYSEYVGHGIPFYRSKEIIELANNKVPSTELFISEDRFSQIAQKFGYPQSNDILLTSVGTLGQVYLVDGSHKFYFKDGNLTWFRNWNDSVFPRYIYHWLRSKIGQQSLMDVSIGSTQAALTIAGLKTIEIPLPPLPEQQAIAEVLSSLDDKIDLLHRSNKTLEEMAETLFRQWFDMSETSKLKLGHIGDFFEETIGGEWGKETLNEEFSVETICIRGTDIGNLIDGIPSPPARYLSDKKFQKCKVLHGDIIIEISGGTEDQSTGRARYFDTKTIEMLGGSVVFSNFCRLLRPVNKEIYPYLYLLLRFLYDRGDFFNLENGTSGIKNLALKSFLNDELYPIPDIETAIKFSEQVLPLLNKTGYNRIQINNLSKLRDTLLPKLMSGQVRVNI